MFCGTTLKQICTFCHSQWVIWKSPANSLISERANCPCGTIRKIAFAFTPRNLNWHEEQMIHKLKVHFGRCVCFQRQLSISSRSRKANTTLCALKLSTYLLSSSVWAAVNQLASFAIADKFLFESNLNDRIFMRFNWYSDNDKYKFSIAFINKSIFCFLCISSCYWY